MIDTSPTTPPPAAAPTVAQRAPRWVGYAVVGLIVGFAVVNGFSGFRDVTVYLIVALFSVAVSLINLPDMLSPGLKLALCSGGALVSMAIIWASIRSNPRSAATGLHWSGCLWGLWPAC